MPTPLKAGFWSWAHTMFGKGPGYDTGLPIFKASVITPDPTLILSVFAQAELYDVTVYINLAGNPPKYSDLVNGIRVYNPSKYEAQVRRFTVAGGASQAVADTMVTALASRRFVIMTIDEPFHPKYGGTITKADANAMGLLHKSIWPGCITTVRAPYTLLTPPPTGGWTGFDYAWSQYAMPLINGVRQSAASYFAEHKAGALAIDLGMVAGLVWPDTHDNTNWDTDNNGATINSFVWGGLSSNPGQVGGAKPTPAFWLANPQFIKDAADAIATDLDCPGYLIWRTYDDSETTDANRAAFLPYEIRSDFVAAWDYMLNKFNARASWTGWRAAKGAVAPPPPPPTTIGSTTAAVTTRVTSASDTYVDIPGAVLSNLNLTAGHQYLLYLTAQGDVSSNAANGYIRAVHGAGATLFAGSECAWRSSNLAHRQNYKHWCLWNAVAGEDVKLQYRVETASGKVIGADQVVLVAIDVSTLSAGSVQNTNSVVSTGLAAGFAGGAAVTFTPGTAGHDWLVLTLAQYTTPSITQSIRSRLSTTGGLTSSEPEVKHEGANAVNDIMQLHTAKVVNLAAVSHTFTEQSANTGGGGPRVYSSVLALDLNQFAAHAFAYASAAADYSGVAFGTQAQSAIITLTADSPVWFLTSHGVLVGGAGATTQGRMQIDNVDGPGTQTADLYRTLAHDATDIVPIQFQYLAPYTAGPHTVDLDASLFTPGVGFGGQARLALAVQLGAGVGANTPPSFVSLDPISVNEGQTIAQTIVASDVQDAEAALTYSVVGALPTGAQFNTAARQFVWTPADNQAGEYTIVFRVQDTGGLTTDMAWHISVVDVPSPIDFTALRNLRFDWGIQSDRIRINVRWNGDGLAASRHGVTGVIVSMADTGRI